MYSVGSVLVPFTLALSLCIESAPMPASSSETITTDWSKQTDASQKWQRIATEHIVRHFHATSRAKSVTKNVVLFIGDGMGMTTITAARILKGQMNAQSSGDQHTEIAHRMAMAEEEQLSFERFDHVALSKTYNLDSQVGDSGACATALMSGVKANFETVGLSGAATLDDCLSSLTPGARVSSIAEWAQQQGKSTGFVTTTRVTHATPAAFYAHSANRYWESDDKLPSTEKDGALCKDIARQLIEDEPGKNLNVIMGGGLRHFISHSRQTSYGKRRDGKNLIESWMEDKQKRGLSGKYIANRKELNQLDTGQVDYLLGLFSSNHLAHEADRNKSDYGEPSLAEMSVKAVQVLKHNPNGFLLLVESGRIDHAHHINNAYRALTDTLALEQAVHQVARMVNLSTTMLLVTADHSHVLTFGGHSPPRGNHIFGHDSHHSDLDHQPYTTLLYGNGPGYNLTYANSEHKDYIQQAAVPRRWATHGGEDVPVYASGAGSEVFTGVLDQTFIPYGIAYATCTGPMKQLCEQHQLASKKQCSTEPQAGKPTGHAESHQYVKRENQSVRSEKEAHSIDWLQYIRPQWRQSSSSCCPLNSEWLLLLSLLIIIVFIAC